MDVGGDLWGYTTAMPIVSIFGHEVGLSPVLQTTFLVAASICLANRFSPHFTSWGSLCSELTNNFDCVYYSIDKQ